MTSLERKVDRLITLLEEKEMASYSKQCRDHQHLTLEMITNTVLGSMVGYFLFRVMDHHFRKA